MTGIVRGIAAGLCATLLTATGAVSSDAGTTPRVLNEHTRNYDTQHIKLELSFDFYAHQVAGTATIDAVSLVDGLEEVLLHARTMRIHSVKRGGRKLKFEHDAENGLLAVRLGQPLKRGQAAQVRVKYEAQPTRGLYFFHPTPQVPDMPIQVWSQGEGEDNRYWFPSYDMPDDRFTTEIVARVPDTLTVIANGVLQSVERNEKRGQATFHWKMAKPHPGYLTSIIVGQYTQVADTVRGVLLNYNMPPGWEQAAPQVFGRTPAMIDFFSDYICPYPYEKYDQTVVQDFAYGGMENITATTLNRRMLHDEHAAPNYSSDPLVAHELAHQWFGDLLTCRTWPHMWLNEGFATYFTDLFFEHARGRDEFLLRRLNQNRGYLGSLAFLPLDSVKLDSTGAVPVEMNGGKAYSRGAGVLHALRFEIGDEAFQKGIANYVRTHYLQNVVTEDFRVALEEVSGRNLERFFRQWVYGAGFPEFKVSYDWDEDAGMLSLHVRQTQKELPAVGLFDVPVNVEITAGEHKVRRVIRCDRRDQTFTFVSPQRPDMVRFDKGNWLLKKLDFEKTLGELRYQLLFDDEMTGRYLAAEALADHGDAAVAPLSRAARHDPFYGVRKKAVEGLGKIGGDAALAAIIGATNDPDARVREAAALTLGGAPSQDAGDVLRKLLALDPNDYVRGAAAASIGKLSTPDAFDLLKGALLQESHRNIIRRRAFQGLAALNDPRVLPLAREYLRYEYSSGAMHLLDVAILDCVKTLAPEHAEVVDIIIQGLENPYFRTRMKAAGLLAELGAKDRLPDIRRVMETEYRNRVLSALRGAVKKLEAKDEVESEK